jgi:antitoxin (DNA-binding transcriptional repressor) of toxin-antitoxin stability system
MSRGGLVESGGLKYSSKMKTLTVQEASADLSRWLRQAMRGEQIAIHEGACAVLLQPLPAPPESQASERLSPREALRLMQEESCLTPQQAE